MPVTFTATTPEVFGSQLAVGPVRAERQPDGKIIVRNTPFFAEVRSEDPAAQDGSRQTRDRAWLEGALLKYQARRALGYEPPMTLRHHFSSPVRVGTFSLTHVDEAEINPGEGPRAVLFGDKIYDDESAFAQATGYVYRSPEISPDSPDELSALALLRDTAPYNKFPSNQETLDAKVREAFEVAGLPGMPSLLAEMFRAQRNLSPQTWRGSSEAFDSYGSPDQKREGDGKWSGGSGGGSSSSGGAGKLGPSPKAQALRAEAAKIRADTAQKNADASKQIADMKAKTAAAKSANAGLADRARELKSQIKSTNADTKRIRAESEKDDDYETNGAATSATPNSYQEEGVMPPEAQAGEKKAPSLEERMEAMASKCFEGMAKKFEAMFSAATSGKKDDAAPEGDKKPEAAESDGDADDQKKPEAAEAAGPNGALPPAVSEVRVGESFSLRVLAGKDKAPASHQSTAPEVEAFGAKLATLETANLGLKARLEKMEREKEAVGHVANAKRALADMGIPTVTEAFESALSKAAVKSGKAGCDELLESVKLTMGLTSRAPETYGAMALGGPAGNGQGPDELKKAIDAFASRPEQSRERSLIQEMFQAYREAPEHLRRSLGSFDKLVAGHAGINPSIMDSRGGMGRA